MHPGLCLRVASPTTIRTYENERADSLLLTLKLYIVLCSNLPAASIVQRGENRLAGLLTSLGMVAVAIIILETSSRH
jgi:hypothetical protein